MAKKKLQPQSRENNPQKPLPYGKILYILFLVPIIITAFTMPASAATVWEKAKEILQDVYNQILLISTIAAVVTAAVALLLMNFSKNGKTVDESRQWLTRIIISWAALNGLGFILAWLLPYFADGKWTG